MSDFEALISKYGDRLTVGDDGAVTWTLSYPVKTGDGEIDKITLRRPKAREIKAIKGKTDGDKTLWIIAQLSGVAPPHLDDLDGEDFAVLGRVFAAFLGISPPIADA